MVRTKITTQDLEKIYDKYGIHGLFHYVKKDKSITIDLFRRIALIHTNELHVFFNINHKKMTVEPNTRDTLIELLTEIVKDKLLLKKAKYFGGAIALILVLYGLLLKTVYTLDSNKQMTPHAKTNHLDELNNYKQILNTNETFDESQAEVYGVKKYTYRVNDKYHFHNRNLTVSLLDTFFNGIEKYDSIGNAYRLQSHSILTDDKDAKYFCLGIVGSTLIGLLGLKYWNKNHDKSQLIRVKNEINESPKDEMDYNNNFEDNIMLHKAFLSSTSIGELRYQLLQLNKKGRLDLDIHFFVRKDGTLRNSFDEIARAIEHYPTSRWNKTMKWFNMYTPKKKLRIKHSKKRSRSRRRSRSHKK